MAAASNSQTTRAAWWSALRTQIRRYLSLLKKWWWVVLLATTAGAFLGAWWSWSMPASFLSTGRMMVGGRVSLPENVSYSEELTTFVGTQIELMQSADVRQRAAERVHSNNPEVEPCPVQLDVAQLPHTAIFVLSATGGKPEYTQKFLNAVMDEYIAMKREMRSERSENTSSAITDQMQRVDKEIRADEEELLDFQKKNNVGFLQEEANSAGQYLVSLKRQLADLRSEQHLLEMLDLDQNIDRTARDSGGTNAAVDDKLLPAGPEAEYLRARQQLAVLEAQRAEFAKVLRPKHPTMVQLAQEIEEQKSVIETFKSQSADRIKSRRSGIELQIQTIEKSVAEWEEKSVALNEKLAEHNRIKSRLDRAKSVYDQLTMSLKSLTVSSRIDQDMVSVYERATPAFPRKPTLEKGLGIGLGIGLAVALAFLFLLDRLDDRMTSMHEFRASFDEKVLAQIPSEPAAAQVKPLEHNDGRHAFAEAFRALRSSIFYMPFEGMAPKTILITSAVPGEGKSTISTNLAITIAFSGARVLLVDGDLRRGNLHGRLGIENNIGLADVLGDQVSVMRATRATSIPNLFLIPRGSNAGHPGELYLGPAMERLLKEVYAEYDYVIFDSSPVMVADDSTSVAPKIDATIFVVRFSNSSARRCRESIEMLKGRQANIIGVVCNAVPHLEQDYYGYAEYYTSVDKT